MPRHDEKLGFVLDINYMKTYTIREKFRGGGNIRFSKVSCDIQYLSAFYF